MAKLYENHLTENDYLGYSNGSGRKANKFSVGAIPHTITSFVIKINRVGLPGICSFNITEGTLDGTIVTSGTTDGDTLTLSTGGELRRIYVTEVPLLANTDYYIEAYDITNPGSNRGLQARFDNAAGTGILYGGAKDAPHDWTDTNTAGLYFEVWGNPTKSPLPSHYNT